MPVKYAAVGTYKYSYLNTKTYQQFADDNIYSNFTILCVTNINVISSKSARCNINSSAYLNISCVNKKLANSSIYSNANISLTSVICRKNINVSISNITIINITYTNKQFKNINIGSASSIYTHAINIKIANSNITSESGLQIQCIVNKFVNSIINNAVFVSVCEKVSKNTGVILNSLTYLNNIGVLNKFGECYIENTSRVNNITPYNSLLQYTYEYLNTLRYYEIESNGVVLVKYTQNTIQSSSYVACQQSNNIYEVSSITTNTSINTNVLLKANITCNINAVSIVETTANLQAQAVCNINSTSTLDINSILYICENGQIYSSTLIATNCISVAYCSDVIGSVSSCGSLISYDKLSLYSYLELNNVRYYELYDNDIEYLMLQYNECNINAVSNITLNTNCVLYANCDVYSNVDLLANVDNIAISYNSCLINCASGYGAITYEELSNYTYLQLSNYKYSDLLGEYKPILIKNIDTNINSISDITSNISSNLYCNSIIDCNSILKLGSSYNKLSNYTYEYLNTLRYCDFPEDEILIIKYINLSIFAETTINCDSKRIIYIIISSNTIVHANAIKIKKIRKIYVFNVEINKTYKEMVVIS